MSMFVSFQSSKYRINDYSTSVNVLKPRANSVMERGTESFLVMSLLLAIMVYLYTVVHIKISASFTSMPLFISKYPLHLPAGRCSYQNVRFIYQHAVVHIKISASFTSRPLFISKCSLHLPACRCSYQNVRLIYQQAVSHIKVSASFTSIP